MVASLKSLTAAQTIRILIQTTHNLEDGRWNLNAGTSRKQMKQIHTTEYVMPY